MATKSAKKNVTEEKAPVQAEAKQDVKKAEAPKDAAVKPAVSAKDEAPKKVAPVKEAAPAKAVTAKEAVPAKEAPAKAEEPKEEAKKAAPRKNASRKKEVTSTIYVEYLGKQVDAKDYLPEIKQLWRKAGRKIRDIKDIKYYVKPEDGKIYFVVNGDLSGSVDII